MRTLNFVIVLIVFTSFVVASEPLRSTDILDFYPYTKELSIGETYQANYIFSSNFELCPELAERMNFELSQTLLPQPNKQL